MMNIMRTQKMKMYMVQKIINIQINKIINNLNMSSSGRHMNLMIIKLMKNQQHLNKKTRMTLKMMNIMNNLEKLYCEKN